MQGPEKNSYKEFDNEKKFLQLENSPPPPPITFLMVRPLGETIVCLLRIQAIKFTALAQPLHCHK